MEPSARETPLDTEPDGRAAEGLRRALARLADHDGRVYYDAEADHRARSEYYSRVDLGAGATVLFHALSALVTGTHERKPPYRPSEELYPWVDLHPDGQLHHIYSGRHAAPEQVIRSDVEIARARSARMRGVIDQRDTLGPRELEATFDDLERELPFNCEHVVPQSWFGKHEPMRGDLHHLFACEPRCNSFRGNTPYAELACTDDHVSDCGRSEPAGFEPTSGKGAVARATMYFLLRYPGEIGDEAREMQLTVMPDLVAWHTQDAVGEYERHRNLAIHEVQGNRNPLIDFPDLAESIDFATSFG